MKARCSAILDRPPPLAVLGPALARPVLERVHAIVSSPMASDAVGGTPVEVHGFGVYPH